MGYAIGGHVSNNMTSRKGSLVLLYCCLRSHINRKPETPHSFWNIDYYPLQHLNYQRITSCYDVAGALPHAVTLDTAEGGRARESHDIMRSIASRQQLTESTSSTPFSIDYQTSPASSTSRPTLTIHVPSSSSPLTKGLSGSLLQSFLSCFSLSTAIPLIAKRTFALELSTGSPKQTDVCSRSGSLSKTETERPFLSWSQRRHKDEHQE